MKGVSCWSLKPLVAASSKSIRRAEAYSGDVGSPRVGGLFSFKFSQAVPFGQRPAYLERVAMKLRGQDIRRWLGACVVAEIVRSIAWDAERVTS